MAGVNAANAPLKDSSVRSPLVLRSRLAKSFENLGNGEPMSNKLANQLIAGLLAITNPYGFEICARNLGFVRRTCSVGAG